MFFLNKNSIKPVIAKISTATALASFPTPMLFGTGIAIMNIGSMVILAIDTFFVQFNFFVSLIALLFIFHN